jgi:hypothetical protein
MSGAALQAFLSGKAHGYWGMVSIALLLPVLADMWQHRSA